MKCLERIREVLKQWQADSDCFMPSQPHISTGDDKSIPALRRPVPAWKHVPERPSHVTRVATPHLYESLMRALRTLGSYWRWYRLALPERRLEPEASHTLHTSTSVEKRLPPLRDLDAARVPMTVVRREMAPTRRLLFQHYRDQAMILIAFTLRSHHLTA